MDLDISFSDREEEPIQTKECDQNYFGEELNETLKNLKMNDLRINDFKCVPEDNNDEIKGFYTDSNYSNFSYYKISISNKIENFTKINEFLYENDCKLQFYYKDYYIDIENYTNPYKPIINSLFLQLNPDFYVKKNVFSENYHIKTDNRQYRIFNLGNQKETKKAVFSRIEDYFQYKGVNTYLNLNKEYIGNYARLYIRVDNKKMEIKREYQNFLDFWAENSAFWAALFQLFNFFFSYYNGFHASRSMAKKLFFFEGTEDNKFNYLQIKKSITSKIILMNRKDASANNINDIKMKDSEDKDKEDKENKEDKEDKITNINSIPFIINRNPLNNNNIPSDNRLNINSDKNSANEEKEEIENRYKNPFGILPLFKIFCFYCCQNKLNFKEKLIKKALDIFEKKLDIYVYIKNMILIDIMFKVLLDDINKDCINFLSRSLIYFDKKNEEEKEEIDNFYKPVNKFNSNNSQKLFGEVKNLLSKKEKTEIEKKIISLFYDY